MNCTINCESQLWCAAYLCSGHTTLATAEVFKEETPHRKQGVATLFAASHGSSVIVTSLPLSPAFPRGGLSHRAGTGNRNCRNRFPRKRTCNRNRRNRLSGTTGTVLLNCTETQKKTSPKEPPETKTGTARTVPPQTIAEPNQGPQPFTKPPFVSP